MLLLILTCGQTCFFLSYYGNTTKKKHHTKIYGMYRKYMINGDYMYNNNYLLSRDKYQSRDKSYNLLFLNVVLLQYL